MGRPPGLTVYTFLVAPLLQQDGLAALAVKAAPLIMMGVGLSLAYRANVWNIGTDGQFTLGAICGGGVALAFPDAPALADLPGVIAGRDRWAGCRLGGAGRLAAHPFQRQRDPDQPDAGLHHAVSAGVPRHRAVARPEGFRLPADRAVLRRRAAPRLIEDSNVHIGVVLAPLIAVALVVHAGKIAAGLSVPRARPGAAGRAFRRLQRNRLVWIAMLISGGLAGLAGLLEVTGTLGQLTTTLSPGYGFTAIIVAFLGRLNPLGVIPAGLLLALTYLGGDAAQINLGLPNAVTGIFQGILLFYLLGCDMLLLNRIRWLPAPPTERCA